MKKRKNRMQVKALHNKIKKINEARVISETSYINIIRSEQSETLKYKSRLQMACDCIVSELDNNDALRAALTGEPHRIKYNGPDHMRVTKKNKSPLSVARDLTPETMDYVFLHKFRSFLNDNYHTIDGFGKLYEVEHNGKRQCLFLDNHALRNMNKDFFMDYMGDLIRGLKEQ